jgi:sulfite exporter TauE/SafE
MRSPATPWECFVFGVVLGSGPCVVSCAPVVVACIAGTRSTWRQGLLSVLVFSVGRSFSYLVLGAAAYGASQVLGDVLRTHGVWVDRVLGTFLLANGLLFAWMERVRITTPLPSGLDRVGAHSVAVAGVLTGLRPCLPMLAVIAYAGRVAGSVVEALAGVGLFSVGTAVSPLLLIGAAAGALPGLFGGDAAYVRAVRVIAGVMLVALGAVTLAQAL